MTPVEQIEQQYNRRTDNENRMRYLLNSSIPISIHANTVLALLTALDVDQSEKHTTAGSLRSREESLPFDSFVRTFLIERLRDGFEVSSHTYKKDLLTVTPVKDRLEYMDMVLHNHISVRTSDNPVQLDPAFMDWFVETLVATHIRGYYRNGDLSQIFWDSPQGFRSTTGKIKDLLNEVWNTPKSTLEVFPRSVRFTIGGGRPLSFRAVDPSRQRHSR